MKGGSPAYELHQEDGLLSQTTNVEHTKPLTYYESSNHDNYSNLYKVSGGGRGRGRGRRRQRIRKSLSKNVKRSYSKNKRRSKRRLSRRKRGGSKKKNKLI